MCCVMCLVILWDFFPTNDVELKVLCQQNKLEKNTVGHLTCIQCISHWFSNMFLREYSSSYGSDGDEQENIYAFIGSLEREEQSHEWYRSL